MNIQEQIEITLRDSLKKFIGAKTNQVTTEQTVKTIMEQTMGQLSQVGTVTVKTLWATWSIKQKIQWIFLNYLGFGRKRINEYLSQRQTINNIIASVLNLLTEKTADQELKDELTDELNDILDTFKKDWMPWFIESCPKTVMMTDVYFTPHKPLSYIRAEFKLKKAIDE